MPGIRDVLERPGVFEDISSAYDSPETTLEGWAASMPDLVHVSSDQVDDRTGGGPLVTDDRPLQEYFLCPGYSARVRDRTRASSAWIAAAVVMVASVRPAPGVRRT